MNTGIPFSALGQPRYTQLIFKSVAAFDAWLKEHTDQIVEFEDNLQDFTKWYLDERGEVLHAAPFQSNIWMGTMVLLSTIAVGTYPMCRTRFDDEIKELKHRVKSITKIAEKAKGNQ